MGRDITGTPSYGQKRGEVDRTPVLATIMLSASPRRKGLGTGFKLPNWIRKGATGAERTKSRWLRTCMDS